MNYITILSQHNIFILLQRKKNYTPVAGELIFHSLFPCIALQRLNAASSGVFIKLFQEIKNYSV